MKTILCYGDSNTYGYNPTTGLRYPSNIRWTGRLAQLLGDEYVVIEEGCNGRTTVYDDPLEGWKNGLDYLRPCLNSHKPVDIVIMMLGSNDLKDVFHASAQEIAAGAETLVRVIQEFTLEKQGYTAEVILVSPPEIGANIHRSPFNTSFKADAIFRSKEFSKYYKEVAVRCGCTFFDAAEWIQSSDEDSLHLTPGAHSMLAGKLRDVVVWLPMKG